MPVSRRAGFVATLAAAALVAFAANSVLARLALGHGLIDPASYTLVRLGAGALTLLAVAAGRRPAGSLIRGSWGSAALLFLYAAPFSLAYVRLTTGTGALVLFAAVQTTMIVAGLRGGERPHGREWLGLAMALGGLVGLVLPGLHAPDPLAALLMALAGAAWGFYSLRGRREGAPLLGTTGNFVRSVPMAVVLLAVLGRGTHLTLPGALLAAGSGALASGLGYAVWYAALPGLTATRAATIQLAVPVLAAAAGVVLLGEPVTVRLVASGAAILAGIRMATW